MNAETVSQIVAKTPATPCYVCDSAALHRNTARLAAVQERTQARILLALKAFAMFSVFPMIRDNLAGVAASSLCEARLGREEFGKEVHGYSPAYRAEEMELLSTYCDHLVFNSLSQHAHLGPALIDRSVQIGLRLNPEYSEIDIPLYDPCRRYSRLGVTAAQCAKQDLSVFSGFHVHNHCRGDSAGLARSMAAFEQRFGHLLPHATWLNLGGGQCITAEDYDIDHLCEIIDDLQRRYDLTIYLEPGEAVAWNAGVLVTTVLDIVDNEMPVAILDVSVSAHMPDVLEMPCRPKIHGAIADGESDHHYRLAGTSCLAGDEMGTYSFPHPLKVGDRLAFLDQLHYTMVKTHYFNGVTKPSIGIYDNDSRQVRVVREFGYDDYRGQLS